MKDFIAISDFPAVEIQSLLDLAAKLKKEYFERGNPPLLKGKVMAMIFQKPSLRTSVSFDPSICQTCPFAIQNRCRATSLKRDPAFNLVLPRKNSIEPDAVKGPKRITRQIKNPRTAFEAIVRGGQASFPGRLCLLQLPVGSSK
jgi:hypothetical protein